MYYTNIVKSLHSIFLALFAVTLTAGSSLALELAAVEAEWTPPAGAPVPIWGYVEISAPGTAAGYTCPAAPVPWTGGPVLNAAAGPLTINVKNCLTDEISVFIPGLPKTLAPVVGADAEGRERLLSFDAVVPPNGTGSYTWNAAEGTYLYHSGTNVRTQVPMGLYGALVVTGTDYPPVVQEEVLLFSEIDPALNADPAGFGGARVSSWNPQYFLINGMTYDASNLPIGINVSEDVLLRFVNAGLETFAPTLDGGLFMDVIAEDGNLYPHALQQYGIELPAGKTMDAVINIGSEGTYTLYDRAGHLANGGLVVKIAATAAAGAPVAVNDAYTLAEDGTLTTLAGDATFPGVLDNDTGGAAEAVLQSGPTFGSLGGGALAGDGSFTYTPNADFNGIDTFTYTANDGLGGPNGNTATVTITVTPVNDAGPVATADGYDAVEGLVLNVPAPGVLDNDTDVDGDMLTVTTTPVASPVNGSLTLNADGSFAYTPSVPAPNSDSFTYEVCDPAPVCDTAIVSINIITVANIAPTAVDDTTSTPRNTPLINYNIVMNDTDPDGTIDPASVVITTGTTTQSGGTVVNNGDGTVTYTPPRPGYRGTDTFQYTVNDNVGDTSNTATVHINVVR